METVFLLLLILIMIIALASGFPVAFSLPGSAVITILLRGMWCQQCILNAPIQSFEQSMSGYGMQVKYLMAGFLAIYALTMLIQFTSFFMSSSSKILNNNSN